MASAFTHAFAGLMTGKIASDEKRPFMVWACLLVLPVLPDMDFIGHFLGVAHESAWHHRGITHSLPFAFLVALAAKTFIFKERPWQEKSTWGLIGLLFLAVASHGVLDALTDGGSGVAFFAPFDDTRYFLPWHPLRVSPMSVRRFFEGRAIPVLKSEILGVWLPLLGIWIIRKVFPTKKSPVPR